MVAIRTQIDEQFGGAVDRVLSGSYELRLPSGYPGCARFYILRPDTSSIDISLPDARRCPWGGHPVFVIINSSSESSETLTLIDGDGTTIATIPADTALEVFCRDNTTAAGSWTAKGYAGAELATPITPIALEYEIDIRQSVNDFVIADYLTSEFGYDGTSAALVRVTVKSGAVVGSTVSTAPAMDASQLGTGSLLQLFVEADAYICGRGGDGGAGGTSVLTAQNGNDGGDALRAGVTAFLSNAGYILAGGGGGGGKSNAAGGAGGGGGAGYVISKGGVSYNNPGLSGTGGGIYAPGIGGVSGAFDDPSDGGTHGAAGDNGDAVGGAAGDAIVKLGETLTKITTGTIVGSEV